MNFYYFFQGAATGSGASFGTLSVSEFSLTFLTYSFDKVENFVYPYFTSYSSCLPVCYSPLILN